jgi:hypothetical protein
VPSSGVEDAGDENDENESEPEIEQDDAHEEAGEGESGE